MARVNVFLKDDLLKAIDAEAAESHMRRSALIQAALARYLAERQEERATEASRRDMRAAGREMDGLAEKLGSWNPVRTIRELRDSRSLRVRETGGPYRGSGRKRRS